MPSRKRNKGRDRKAKKAEVEAERIEREKEKVSTVWKQGAGGEDKTGRKVVLCNHGCTLMIPNDNDHPVCSFMDTFHINAANQLDVVDNLSDTFKKHPQFWNSESFRAMAINVFVRIGTNMFFDKRTSSLGFIAQAIVVLENYNGSGYIESTYNFRVVATKFRDLLGSSSLRDELKFFRKRISCSCLKDMHLKMRKSCPKTGQCFGCDRTTERALLMVCSRCRISQYCSRRCQVEHWPIHKCKECGDYF